MSDHEDRVEERAGIYAQGSCGWQSSFPVLTATLAAVVRLALQRFLPDSVDAQLLAWGTGLRSVDGAWSNADAKRYAKSTGVRDALNLRKNAYRVLLTRGRDGTIALVSRLPELEETATYLVEAGCLLIDTH